MNIEKSNAKQDFENQSPTNRELSEITDAAERKNNDVEIIKPDIQYIENTSLTALFEQNRAAELRTLAKPEGKSDTDENERGGLTEKEKAKVREQHPEWPDEIIDAISSWKEYEVLNKANLKLEYINGRPCLIRTDIDMDQTDAKGRTNRERMEQGLAPIGSDGKPINLHHIGQRADSPLAELTETEHQENYSELHPYKGPTEVHEEGNNWQVERESHWKTRSNQN